MNRVEANTSPMPNVKRLANNLVASFKDSSKLKKSSYEFIYLLSGFIAHYNLYGFIAYYREHSMKEDFLRSYDVRNKERFIKDPYFTDETKKIGRGTTYAEYYRWKYEVICEVLRQIG